MEEQFEGKKIGNYTLKGEIGEGAFSSVCLAVDSKRGLNNSQIKKVNNGIHAKSANCYYACKIISRKKIENRKLTMRFEQEIRIHQLMHHPNVVQMIDVTKDSTYYYVFLEFCACGELFDYVVDRSKLKENEAAIFFKQILIALNYIHEMKVAHRDLKPENILLDEFGRIKISDFGLSKITPSNDCLTKTPCGSPCYASPECLSGKPYDPRKSDIWSCGVILYAITTGTLPWTKRTQTQLFAQIKSGQYKIPNYLSTDCSDLITRLMTVDNQMRITIEDALKHPFLKDTVLPDIILDPKFVSLRKVDRFFGIDKDFHLNNIIEKGLAIHKDGTFVNLNENFFRVKKSISLKEIDEGKRKENIEKLSEVVKPRTCPLKAIPKGNRKAMKLPTVIRNEIKRINISQKNINDGTNCNNINNKGKGRRRSENLQTNVVY